MVRALLEYTYHAWKDRNEYLHGTTIQEGQEKKLEKARKEATMLYDKSTKVKLTTDLEKELNKIKLNQIKKVKGDGFPKKFHTDGSIVFQIS